MWHATEHPQRLRLLLLSPALAVVLVLFGGGLLGALAMSLGYMPLLGQQELTLAHYASLFRDPVFYSALGWSLYLALTSTLVATALAVPAALVLRRSDRQGRLLVFQLPLTLPHLLAAVAMVMLFSQSGLLARLAHALGWIDQPSAFPALVNDPWGFAIIAAYVWKETPFITLILLAALRGQGEAQEAAARTLGASPWQCLRHITLPRIAPALAVAAVFVFTFTFGAFEVPLLLGPTTPEALPVAAWNQFRSVDLGDRPLATAMALVLALISSLMCLLYLRLARQEASP